MHVYKMCWYIYTCLINNCCLIFKQEKKYFEKQFIYKKIKIIKKLCCLEKKNVRCRIICRVYIYDTYNETIIRRERERKDVQYF